MRSWARTPLIVLASGFATSLIWVALLVTAMLYDAAGQWTHPPRTTPPFTPAVEGLTYEDVQLVTEDGLHLAAYYIPSTSGAALIVLHGIRGNRGGDLAFARELAGRGYGVILPDLRAHGDSEGTTSTLGLLEVRDVRSAVDYLKQRPDVDTTRIGIYGGSLGAAVALMASAEIPDLRAVVADSGFASVEWVVQHQFQQLESVPAWLAPVVVTFGSWQAGVDVKQISPVNRIARISPRPVLLIHGDRDETFTVENAQLLFEAAREPKELWIDHGVGHRRLFASDPDGYVNRVAGFFDRELRPATQLQGRAPI